MDPDHKLARIWQWHACLDPNFWRATSLRMSRRPALGSASVFVALSTDRNRQQF